MGETGERLAYVDIARGVAACAVVATHVVVLERPGLGLPGELARIFLFSASVPLYAFTSGVVLGAVTKPVPSLPHEIRRRFLALMVPYYVWSLVYWLIDVASGSRTTMGLGQYLVAVTLDPHAQGRMWFLYVLFASQVAFAVVTRISARPWWILSSVLLVVAISVESTFPAATWVYACLAVGFLFGRRSEGRTTPPWQSLLAFAVGAAALPFAVEQAGLTQALMAKLRLPGAGPVTQAAFLVSGLSLSLAITTALQTVTVRGRATQALAYLGRQSLGVYVTQFLFLNRLEGIPMWAMPVVWAAVLGLCVITVHLLGSTRFTRAAFLGRFSRPRVATPPVVG